MIDFLTSIFIALLCLAVLPFALPGLVAAVLWVLTLAGVVVCGILCVVGVVWEALGDAWRRFRL